jgi:hypothetical protein
MLRKKLASLGIMALLLAGLVATSQTVSAKEMSIQERIVAGKKIAWNRRGGNCLACRFASPDLGSQSPQSQRIHATFWGSPYSLRERDRPSH